jgi:cyclase
VLKKRVIFSLIYADGYFNQSRNFSLQRVGDADWLVKNYRFFIAAEYIDELIVVDASRNGRDRDKFLEAIRKVTKDVFVPLTLGGGIREAKDAEMLFAASADKVLVNSVFFENQSVLQEIERVHGRQSMVLQIDYKLNTDGKAVAYSNNAQKEEIEVVEILNQKPRVGEIILHSIDQDGTARGFDLSLSYYLKSYEHCPIIMSGGGGKTEHFLEVIDLPSVDAAATANLLNFVGNGLKNLRRGMLDAGVDLPIWDYK